EGRLLPSEALPAMTVARALAAASRGLIDRWPATDPERTGRGGRYTGRQRPTACLRAIATGSGAAHRRRRPPAGPACCSRESPPAGLGRLPAAPPRSSAAVPASGHGPAARD